MKYNCICTIEVGFGVWATDIKDAQIKARSTMKLIQEKDPCARLVSIYVEGYVQPVDVAPSKSAPLIDVDIDLGPSVA